jgi:hypothetical protein
MCSLFRTPRAKQQYEIIATLITVNESVLAFMFETRMFV